MNPTRRRALAAALLAAGALALAGCAQEYTPSGNGVSVVHIDVDGRTVPCVVAGGGGIDCDWEGAR